MNWTTRVHTRVGAKIFIQASAFRQAFEFYNKSYVKHYEGCTCFIKRDRKIWWCQHFSCLTSPGNDFARDRMSPGLSLKSVSTLSHLFRDFSFHWDLRDLGHVGEELCNVSQDLSSWQIHLIIKRCSRFFVGSVCDSLTCLRVQSIAARNFIICLG